MKPYKPLLNKTHNPWYALLTGQKQPDTMILDLKTGAARRATLMERLLYLLK
jgi:hypothetical protein